MSRAAHIVNEMVDEEWYDGWQPTPMILAWFRHFLMMQRDGSMWASPTSGLVYRIDKTNKTITLVTGDPNDERNWHKKNIVTLGKLGWTVLPGMPEPDQSFAESEEAKNEISRLVKPVPNERGIIAFRHKSSRLEVEGRDYTPVIQAVVYGTKDEIYDGTGEQLYTDAILTLRDAGHHTVRVVLDAYLKWGKSAGMPIDRNEEGHPCEILNSLQLVKRWVGTSGKVATLEI